MLYEYREKMGLTQEEFAELVNISARQYQRIEANPNCTKIKVLKRIIKALNMSDDDILKLMKEDVDK